MREEAKLEQSQIVLTIHEAQWSRLRRRWRSRYTIEFRTRLTWLDQDDQPVSDSEAPTGEFVYELASGIGDAVFAHTVVRVDASRAQRFETMGAYAELLPLGR